MNQSQSALEQLFTKSLPNKVSQLQNSLKVLKNDPSARNIDGLFHQVKKLSMLADAVQLNQVNSHCKNIMNFLQNIIEAKAPLNDENFTLLQAQIEILSHSIELSKMPLHLSKESLSHLHYHTKIILALNQQGLADDFAKQFAFFGYETIIANDFEHLQQIVKSAEHVLVFAAVIMDMVFCKSHDTDQFDVLPNSLPLIFLSQEDNIETRLFSVRVGGHAFLKKPIEFSGLLEKIDDLVVPVGQQSPYRVMMIEDSKTQGSIIQNNLEEAGMIVELIADPFQVNNRLQEFQPELILMDLYMPKCTGIELAAVVRQQETYVGVPIVFLSSESDLTKQMDAMRLGGDDFLTKPIQKDHLIAAVSTRIERSRELRAEMIQDSLTGLLNHTRVLEQLTLEIARAERDQTSLSFVMMDIDNFKQVNDLYGHPVGDRVIKNIARLFKQRFRKSDSIGRYGGEEFAAILPHSDAGNILPLLNDIRESFANIVFTSDDGEDFHVTLSGGVANLSPGLNNVDEIVQAADKALYTAKHNGRNQIVVSNES